MATFAEIEVSEYEGEPSELYEFIRGLESWRFTSADEDKTINGSTYSSIPMQRNSIEQSQSVSRSPLTLNMTKDNNLVTQYIEAPPAGIINLTIRKLHEDQTDSPIIIWIGRVINVRFTDKFSEVRCEPLITSLNRQTLRRLYQAQCPHVLYGPQCALDANSFKVDTTIDSINPVNNLEITAAALNQVDVDWWAGGYIDFTNSAGNTERRFITTSTATPTVITISLGSADLVPGKAFTAFFGCDHSTAICLSKFNNIDNYGGYPFMPINGKNPFGSTPLF